jgi:sugar phosphate isomerase/epimerase
MTTLIGMAPSRTFPGDWLDALDFCEKNGFEALELKYELPFTLPDRLNANVIGKVAERIRASNLFLSLHGPYTNIGSLVDVRYEGAIAEHLDAIEVAKTIGARTYTLHGGWVESKYSTDELYGNSRQRVADALVRILDVAGPVKICLENQNNAEGGKHKTNCLASDLQWYGNKLPQLCYTFDLGHANVIQSVTPSQFLREIGPDRIGIAHVHDNDGTKDQHRALADGTTNWDDFIETYVALGSQFPLMLELGDPEDLLSSQRILREALAGVRQA